MQSFNLIFLVADHTSVVRCLDDIWHWCLIGAAGFLFENTAGALIDELNASKQFSSVIISCFIKYLGYCVPTHWSKGMFR